MTTGNAHAHEENGGSGTGMREKKIVPGKKNKSKNDCFSPAPQYGSDTRLTVRGVHLPISDARIPGALA